MNKQRQGYNFERIIANWLRRNGFYVIRSAASKGVADLVAIPQYIPPDNDRHPFIVYYDKPALIQCKSTTIFEGGVGYLFRECTDFTKQHFIIPVNRYLFVEIRNRIFVYRYFQWIEDQWKEIGV